MHTVAGRDLTALNLTIFVPVGQMEACFQLVAINDDIAENDEIITITFEAANPMDIVSGTVTATIFDNDGMFRNH